MGSLRCSKNFIIRNAGQILARTKVIDQRLAALKIAYEHADLKECPYLLGKISALRDNRTALHKDAVKAMVETRQDLSNCIDFNEEQAFLKGYIHGIEIVLQIDREIYDEDTNFIFFIYSERQTLLDKYLLAFRSIDAFSELSGNGLQYYLSSSAEDICNAIDVYKTNNQFIVVVLYDAESLPDVKTMQTLASDRHDCIYLHKDLAEDNVAQLIYKFLAKTST